MFPLQLGRICWAVAPGERGGGKLRPMIVAGRVADGIRDSTVFVIVCSTTFDDPLRADEIAIPWSSSEFSVTGLREPTVAVCNWKAMIARDGIKGVSGMVPRPILLKIFGAAGIPFVPQR